MSKYDSIKTAAELVAEVRLNGLSMAQEDICRAQDIFGHTPITELNRLANDVGWDNDKGEPDPHGTWASGRSATQATFYQIAFAIWNWEDAVRFWNQHTNPERRAYRETKEENSGLLKAKEKLESLRDTLLKEQDRLTAENKELQEQVMNLVTSLEEADEDIVHLKAELYDYIKAMD